MNEARYKEERDGHPSFKLESALLLLGEDIGSLTQSTVTVIIVEKQNNKRTYSKINIQGNRFHGDENAKLSQNVNEMRLDKRQYTSACIKHKRKVFPVAALDPSSRYADHPTVQWM